MDLDLLRMLIEAGSSGVIIYMLYDMRREAREQREQTWALLRYLIEREDSWNNQTKPDAFLN